MKTIEEKLKMVLTAGNKLQAMDRFSTIGFQLWPHQEGEGFEHGEMALEVFLNGKSVAECKTLGEALDEVAKHLGTQMSGRAVEVERAQEDASRWRQAAANLLTSINA